ncbi:MAG: hypothetical protein IJ784_11180 [Ruminiclostridium sp.]|nr:hypothetical protein [Ruminiclostridium sp.]
MSAKERITAPSGYTSGEFAVGTKCFTVVDKGRKMVVDDGTEDRKIAVRMYYPVNRETVAGKKFAAIFSDAKKAALIKAYHIRNVSDDMNCAEYYEDVPIVSDRKFPLIMFSMGYNAYVECNTFLLCALASRGYIVASVGHAHEALENDYDDGTTDRLDKRINKAMYTSMAGAVLAQNKLMKKKLGYAEADEKFDEFQNKYTPFLKGRTKEWGKDIEKAVEAVKERYADSIDLSRGIGVTGHSLGGCTAYYLCRSNDEFSCGINIDGAMFGDFPEETMEMPFCQISCRQNVNAETKPLLNTNADTYHVIFDDMAHIGFTDAKFFIPVKFISGKLEPKEMFRHLEYCHITFFDKYLKGKDISFDGLQSEKVEYKKIKIENNGVII